MKKKKLMSLLMSLAMVLSFMSGASVVKADEGEVKVVIADDNPEEYELIPGKTVHVKVPVVSSRNETVFHVTASAVITDRGDGNKSDIFKVKNVKLTRKDNDVNAENTIWGVKEDPTYVEFDVTTKEEAAIGQYYAKISFSSRTDNITLSDLKVPCAVNSELRKSELVIAEMSYDKKNVVPGGKSEIKLKVHNDGDTELKSAYLTVDYPKTADGNAEIAKDYTKTQISLGNVKPGDTIPVSLPIKILATATAGEKVIKLNFNYKSSTGEVEKNTEEIYIDITKNEAAPELAVTGITYSGDIRVGNSFDVNLAMKNVGKSQAKKVQVSIIEGLGKDTFVPNYSTAAISVRDIKKGATGQATIPLNVPNDTTKGTKSIKVQINYEDSNGAKYKLEKEIYIVVKESTSTKTEDGTPNITIKNVSQSPSSPEAGGTVCMEYDIVNTGLIPVSEFKISASGFAENTFSPITSEPYIYVGELGAGKTQHISMTFRVSKNVTAGYGTVPLTYTYKYGKAGTEESKTATLNVIDIINENGDNSKSVPKLIISNFSTGTDKLKTGENFVFQYSIQNTHPSVAAKNIKVTVSQAENIFTVTSGSNSSYIDIIQPGQTHDCGIELNVKPDATTKSYPLVIKMQYEYEGAAASPTTGKIGEEVEETINLTVSENAKVSADNIMVQSYDEGVIVNQSVPLTFQFSNLGKSPIYNVSAVITGDFTKTDGDKQIIGTVNAGDYKDVEIYVTPSMEGDCTGQVVITYEDSTGEVMESSYDFTSFVMPEDNGGGFDPGMFPEEPPVETKKPNLPVWAFVLIQIAILVVVIPVTRGIIIKCYKKKLEKEDEVI